MDDITLENIFAKFRQDLLDAAHGASRGMSAGLVGAPVDITSMALRGVGLPIPSNPVGGSDWIGQKMENMGILRPQLDTPSEKMGNVLGGLITPNTIGKVGQTVEQGVSGVGRMAGQAIDDAMMGRPGILNQALRPSQPLPITAYHGSPHSFDAFDASKIGMGEGAQVFGHGLYFSENPKVAESYKIKPEGILYKTHISNTHLPNMLDWDKPLSQQSKEVQEAAKKLGNRFSPYQGSDPSGEALYQRISAGLDSEAKTTELLKKAGITGIKYLDANSRIKGEGTRNFVIFDDKIPKIISKK